MSRITAIASKYGIQWVKGYSVNMKKSLEADIKALIKKACEEQRMICAQELHKNHANQDYESETIVNAPEPKM